MDNLIKYGLKGVAGGSLIFAYNVFFQGRRYKDTSNLYDAGLMVGSVVASEWINDMIDDTNPLKNLKIIGKVFNPILTTAFYTTAYEYFYKYYYNYGDNRSVKDNIMIGFIVTLIAQYIENPLLGFFTNIQIL